MRKQQCDGKCLDKAQEALKTHGVALDTALAVDFKAGRGTVVGPFLKVHWLSDKPKRGKSLPSVLPAYCPWCGKATAGQRRKKPTTKKKETRGARSKQI